MAEFVWEKSNLLKKACFCLGWTAVLNLVFWIAIIIIGSMKFEDKFWSSKTFFVVYVFGWIVSISLIFMIITFAFA